MTIRLKSKKALVYFINSTCRIFSILSLFTYIFLVYHIYVYADIYAYAYIDTLYKYYMYKLHNKNASAHEISFAIIYQA